MTKRRLLVSAFSMLLALGTSSCLKTRAQLKEEGGDESSSRPVATQVKDVQPQGSYAIDEIKSELTRLNGRIEDVERARQQDGASASKDSARKDEVKKLETRIMELEQAQANMLEALKKIQEAKPAADTPEAFERGKSQFEDGEFEVAADSFTSYLKSPKVKNAEEATFLRAEAYFKLKQFKKAIVDYSKFPEKFTKSKHMPAALLRIGQSFDALGMKDDAKGFYQELAEKFPKSPEAKKARPRAKLQ